MTAGSGGIINNVLGFLRAIPPMEASATSFTLGSGPDALYYNNQSVTILCTYTGTNFTSDAQGNPVGGTITGAVDTMNGETRFSVSGIHVPVATFMGEPDSGFGSNYIQDFLLTRAAGYDNPLSATGGAYFDEIFGTAGNDTISLGGGDDTLNGSSGNDLLQGNQGRDVLSGDAGDDTVHGGKGNDIIADDAGNDVYYGEKGTDTFLFYNAVAYTTSNHDTIMDFTSGTDTVYVGSTLYIIGRNAVGDTIIVSSANTITLLGVAPEELQQGDIHS